MSVRVRLLSAGLRYPPELALYTAASGSIPVLDELYLVVERDGRVEAFGELRENIEYLSGVSPARIRANLIAGLEAMDWREPTLSLLEPTAVTDSVCAPARALLDCAFFDARARASGVPLAVALGGRFEPALPTNHCVFWGDDEQLERLTRAYVQRGFTKLKLRVAVAEFERDVERLARMRGVAGDVVELAVDANGRWSADEAIERIERLAPYRLAYVEQPVAEDWHELERVLAATDVPIMLDESVRDVAAIDRICGYRGRVWAHLKLVKLGGIGVTLECARRLTAGRVRFMMGHMNEGAGATAFTAHTAMACRAPLNELYGADGLENDPVSGLAYRDGCLMLPEGPGIALEFDDSACACLWSNEF